MSEDAGREVAARRYVMVNKTQREEDAYDLVTERTKDGTYEPYERPSTLSETIAYMIKGASGAGLLAAHAGFAQAGFVAIPLTTGIVLYMFLCLKFLVTSLQKVYKRSAISSMTYADAGEAAFALSHNAKIRKMAPVMRVFITLCFCVDLFGACCCYQLMIATSIKQVVEDTHDTPIRGVTPNYWDFKHYMLAILVPMLIICLLKQLKNLGRLSIIGNILVLVCLVTTMYYAIRDNSAMKRIYMFNSFSGVFSYIGIIVLSVSPASLVVTAESYMAEPDKFSYSLILAMAFVSLCALCLGFFGYTAFSESCRAPITVNFPMQVFPMILKVAVALSLFITHAVSFHQSFDLIFHYFKKCHKNSNKLIWWELLYRAIIVTLLNFIGIVIPSASKLMSFLGCFALCTYALVIPNIIKVVVYWERPGFGKFKWRLLVCILLIIGGLVIFAVGSFVGIDGLINVYQETREEMFD